MNYHNFASRLTAPRTSPKTANPNSPKSGPKSPRRPVQRRLIVAAAAAAMLLLSLGADAAPQSDNASATPPARAPLNTPTLIVTAAGLAVALLRAPGLWRRDFVW
jgi:hypothetical protein